MCAFLVLRRAKLCAHTLKASVPCLPLPKRKICQCKSCTIDIKTDKQSPDREKQGKERCEWLKR